MTRQRQGATDAAPEADASTTSSNPGPRLVQNNDEPADGSWLQSLDRVGNTRNARPRKMLRNALIALRGAPVWRNAFTYNEATMAVILMRQPPRPWPQGGEFTPRVWNDQDDVLLCEWLQRQKIELGISAAHDAALCVARERPFHPIRDYLDTLVWDKTPRVAKWLSTYLGVEDNEYTNAVGERWLISAVARIRQPGIKADCVLILEGEQGLGKSAALRILAGDTGFTDQSLDFSSKDASIALAGKWIVELAELESFKGASVERLKAWLSRQFDYYRPPYGRTNVEKPRQCVFVGTTNQKEFLKDVSGNRRFWPVECVTIDLESLARDRDQLWAEAQDYFRQGKTWWLNDPKLKELHAAQVEERMEEDPLQGVVERQIANQDEVKLLELVMDVFMFEDGDGPEKVEMSQMKRVVAILRRLGFELGHKRDSDGKRRKVYRRRVASRDTP